MKNLISLPHYFFCWFPPRHQLRPPAGEPTTFHLKGGAVLTSTTRWVYIEGDAVYSGNNWGLMSRVVHIKMKSQTHTHTHPRSLVYGNSSSIYHAVAMQRPAWALNDLDAIFSHSYSVNTWRAEGRVHFITHSHGLFFHEQTSQKLLTDNRR